MAAPQQVPLKISVAPFPEGFEGDLDETFQQAVQLMEAFVEGNFLTGLILPPGTTLPTTDQGPIAMGGTWYFYNSSTGSYQPQSISAKTARNYAKNAVYQIAQLPTMASTFALPSGDTNTYDMVLTRATVGTVLSIAPDVGPPASADTDNCPAAIKYVVGPTLVPTLAATDRFVHEHLIEGSDIVMIQGEILTLGFSVFTGVPGTYSVYITNGARDASFVSNFVVQTANTWQRVRVSGIPALPTGTIGTWGTAFSEGATGLRIGVVFAIGSQFQTATTNLNKWIAGAFYGTANNSNFCTVVNNTFKISAIKLEASPSATYCTVNSFEQDLHDAIRYYWTTFGYQQNGAGSGVPLLGTASLLGGANLSGVLDRRMAKVPTITFNSWTKNTAGMLTNLSLSNVDVPVTTPGYVGQKGFALNQAVTSVQNGTTNATVNVTGLTATANLAVGMAVSGTGIPAGATIATIVSGTAITLSAAASGSATVALTFQLTNKADALSALVTADARLT